MQNILKKVVKLKNNKKCYNEYIKCFTTNKNSEILFQKSKVFGEIKEYVKRVSK